MLDAAQIKMISPHVQQNHCDNCASDFNTHFALGCRIYSERVWLCSVECYRQLRAKWYPTPTKPNRSLWQFIAHLIGV